jgi:hypothetical protein
MTYPQETKEFQPIRVKVDGVEVVEGVEVAVIPPSTRPIETDWVAATSLSNGHLAVLVDGLAPAVWNVWARVTTVDEKAVVYCGNFKVTA